MKKILFALLISFSSPNALALEDVISGKVMIHQNARNGVGRFAFFIGKKGVYTLHCSRSNIVGPNCDLYVRQGPPIESLFDSGNYTFQSDPGTGEAFGRSVYKRKFRCEHLNRLMSDLNQATPRRPKRLYLAEAAGALPAPEVAAANQNVN